MEISCDAFRPLNPQNLSGPLYCSLKRRDEVLERDAKRSTAMRELFNMTITNATLFPDLGGLARSMGYEFEFSLGL